MAHRNDTWLDRFSHPNLGHEIADLCFHADQIVGFNTDSLSIRAVHPHRIAVRDFIKPFTIRRTGVDQSWKTKVWQQNHFAIFPIDFIGMDMTL